VRESGPKMAFSALFEHELVRHALYVDFASDVRQERLATSQSAEERISGGSRSAV
jgi:hypothetical protein